MHDVSQPRLGRPDYDQRVATLPDDIRIRSAQPEDAERLREIFMAAKGSWGYDTAMVQEAAADLDLSPEAMQAKEVYVADLAGEPVAFASIVRGSDVWRLDDLWVDPAWMGRGIGRHLFMYAADRARLLGARRLEWETDPNAVGFYEKMGGAYVRDSPPTIWGRVVPVMGIDLPVRTARDVARRVAREAGRVADSVADSVADTGEAIADRVGPVMGSVRPAVRAARARRQRARSQEPLPNLLDVHPEARYAPVRELGLFPIPVSEIRGTAVEGPAQRGLDFLPLPPFRSRNWQARWQRVRNAVDRLAVLPPIEVLKTADGYWVTDGHNRVAAALATGQLDIDAAVGAVQLPGDPASVPAGPLGPVLAGTEELQAAGRGMLTHGSSLEGLLPPPQAAPLAHDPPSSDGTSAPGLSPEPAQNASPEPTSE
jgi:GNAT superfamily N-acetyltransferase